MRRDTNLDMDKSFINIINLIVDHKLCSMHCTSLFFTQTSMGKLPVRSGLWNSSNIIVCNTCTTTCICYDL